MPNFCRLCSYFPQMHAWFDQKSWTVPNCYRLSKRFKEQLCRKTFFVPYTQILVYFIIVQFQTSLDMLGKVRKILFTCWPFPPDSKFILDCINSVVAQVFEHVAFVSIQPNNQRGQFVNLCLTSSIYNIICWFAGTNESSTKCPMFQVSFFS